MHVLRFFSDDDGYQAAIFAETDQRASEIWTAIGERFWLMPRGWLGSELETWTLFGQAPHEHEARKRCVEGIGAYSPGQGWTILPLDYDAIGIVPPIEKRH